MEPGILGVLFDNTVRAVREGENPMAIFSKRHYEALARVFSDYNLEARDLNWINGLAELFESDNPAFDWPRWSKAVDPDGNFTHLKDGWLIDTAISGGCPSCGEQLPKDPQGNEGGFIDICRKCRWEWTY